MQFPVKEEMANDPRVKAVEYLTEFLSIAELSKENREPGMVYMIKGSYGMHPKSRAEGLDAQAGWIREDERGIDDPFPYYGRVWIDEEQIGAYIARIRSEDPVYKDEYLYLEKHGYNEENCGAFASVYTAIATILAYADMGPAEDYISFELDENGSSVTMIIDQDAMNVVIDIVSHGVKLAIKHKMGVEEDDVSIKRVQVVDTSGIEVCH